MLLLMMLKMTVMSSTKMVLYNFWVGPWTNAKSGATWVHLSMPQHDFLKINDKSRPLFHGNNYLWQSQTLLSSHNLRISLSLILALCLHRYLDPNTRRSFDTGKRWITNWYIFVFTFSRLNQEYTNWQILFQNSKSWQYKARLSGCTWGDRIVQQ